MAASGGGSLSIQQTKSVCISASIFSITYSVIACIKWLQTSYQRPEFDGCMTASALD